PARHPRDGPRRRRGPLAPGAARARRRESPQMNRTLAPFGRRLLRMTRNEPIGAYRMLWAADPDGPRDPRPGQFYMLAAGSAWGGEDGRPYLPRAFSFARAKDGQLAFLLEAIGPGTERL